jgi:AraC-like DNA-binding protein
MASVRRINAVWARQIADLLDARGRQSSMIFREVGLDPKRVRQEDARIPYAKHAALIEAAASHLDDPSFGLHFGSSADLLDVGALVYVAANSPNLGRAIQNFLNYLRINSEGARAHLDSGDQLATFTWEFLEPLALNNRQNNEMTLCIVMHFFRFLVGRHIRPEWVEFRHSRKDGIKALEQFFGSKVTFASGRNVIILKRALLELPCKNPDPRLLKILKAHCDTLLAKLGPDTDLKQQVEHLISNHLTSGAITAKNVAQELAMSERTLARRLAKRGTTFGQLVDNVRRGLAERYLSEPGARANQISYMLGYRDPAAFTTAFRRWTGKSPMQYRASVL